MEHPREFYALYKNHILTYIYSIRNENREHFKIFISSFKIIRNPLHFNIKDIFYEKLIIFPKIKTFGEE